MATSGESTPRVIPPFKLQEVLNECVPDVNQDVALLHLTLLHLGRIVESSIQAVLAPEGLELSEHSVLSALWFAGPPHKMSPTQLSHVILQTTSGMSKTLRRVEGLGLIERVSDPNDGRARLVVLTPKGRGLAERPLRQLVSQWCTQLKDLEDSDLNQVAQAVWSLVPHMDPRFETSAVEASEDVSPQPDREGTAGRAGGERGASAASPGSCGIHTLQGHHARCSYPPDGLQIRLARSVPARPGHLSCRCR